ncbi:hypothetical protein [Actibacterium mucosum]|nr:hypothetical protein [Actibacterium mucosum]
MTLSEAVSVYLKQKGHGRPVTFHRAAGRSCGFVIVVAGGKGLRAYFKKDANTFLDVLIKRGLSGSSMTRIIGTVRSATNFAASGMGVSFTYPLSGVYFDRQSGVQERETLPVQVIGKLQAECLRVDDELP